MSFGPLPHGMRAFRRMNAQIILMCIMLVLVAFHALCTRVSQGCESRVNPVPNLRDAQAWAAETDVALCDSPFTTSHEQANVRKSKHRVARMAIQVPTTQPIRMRMGLTKAYDRASYVALYGSQVRNH